MNMNSEQRHDLMVEMLRGRERIEVEEFAEECQTSAATIRRDLDSLEQRGVLRRVHGAAISLLLTGYEPSYEQRALENRWSKAAIAQAVSNLIQDREFVFLDSGSTATHVATALQQRIVTVLPANLHAVRELSGGRSQIILPGGGLVADELALRGPMAEANIASLRFDVAVITPCAFDFTTGVMAHDLADSAIKKAAIAAARRVIVACDSAKWERSGPAIVAGLDKVDHIVTDRKLSDAEKSLVSAAKVGVTLV